MRFEPFIARRYLFSGQHKALVSVITVISIAGVAVGVFALIVVIAVMEGFDANLMEKIIGAYAHIEVARASVETPPIKAEEILPRLRAMPEVKAAAPVIMRQALITVGKGDTKRQIGLFVQGIDLKEEPKITTLMHRVKGNRDPSTTGIVIGRKAYQQLYVPLGTQLQALSPTVVETANGRMVAMRDVSLCGYFETGFPEADEMVGYMSLDGARRLFLMDADAVDTIHLMLRDPKAVREMRDKIQRELGPGYSVTTWQERNPVLFSALKLEEWAMFIILLLIVLVAAFNIIGTLIMVVMEKTREIGILKSMGATRNAILRIFLYQGLIIGGIGTTLGAVSGMLLCYVLKYHVKINILSEAYLSDRIPLLINPWMNALIIVCSMAICLGASLYPARQAARLDPVEALRYE